MKKAVLFIFSMLGFFMIGAGAIVESPNGRIIVSFGLESGLELDNVPVYNVTFYGKRIIDDSYLGFELEEGDLKDGFRILSTRISSYSGTWKPIYGERSIVKNEYNQLEINLYHKHLGYKLNLIFRCYDAGVALRYTIQQGDASSEKVNIKRENTEFRFLGDHFAWCTLKAQGLYSREKISTMGAGIERPLTLKIDSSTYVVLGEAALVDYARMKLTSLEEKSHVIVSDVDSPVRSDLPLTTPWRVVMLGESPGKLLENNDIILNLNEPCALEDVSWIKPGKVIREMTLTTAGGKACVDFAVKHNLQYVHFDAGWYGPENSEESDATTVTVDPKRYLGPLDLHEVIEYADKHGIGIILYVNRRALENQLDEILPLYSKWGVKGVKFGFVRVGAQEWTTWLHEAVRKAAKYGLMVDIHDDYRPTGFSRTYPNLMTQEGIRGDEESSSNSLTLTTLFTRMLSGAGDNTICYFDSRVDENSTNAYKLAKTICIYSPWQYLYWYDRPENSPRKKGETGGQENIIRDVPELEFFDAVPTVWDDTKVIHGSISKYAVIARRSGKEWFIGCMNSGKERIFKVPLDFLEKDMKYIAYIYYDDHTIDTRTQVGIKRIVVNADTTLKINLTAQGGQAVRILPIIDREN